MAVPIWVSHYIGLPFVEHGRHVYGLDCWGLVRLVLFEQFDVVLPSLISGYDNTKDVGGVSNTIEKESSSWKPIKLSSEKIGDVIVLRMRGYPMHVGVIVGDGKFLHISQGINSTFESYKSSRWRDRISGIYRHTKL